MTTILALDTSTDACSAALYRHGDLISCFELAAKSHTQRLLPMVDELLQQADIALANVDAIAFGRGPGSFTGLRICLGIVQGLAFGRDLPVIPVSTLAAMAAGHLRSTADSEAQLPLLVALDARMEEVYWALFEPDGKYFEPKIIMNEQVMAPALVAEDLSVQSLKQQFVALGPGWHYEALTSIRPAQTILNVYPQAEDIARIAVEKYMRGEIISVMDAEPVYLRDSVSWQKRQRIRSIL